MVKARKTTSIGARPVRATGGLSKAVIQITLIKRRYRIDCVLRFIGAKQQHPSSGGDRGQANRNRVAARSEDHQALDGTASTAKLVEPYQSSSEGRIYVWLKLGLTHPEAGKTSAAISNDQSRVNAGQVPAIVARGNRLLHAKARQISFDHRRQLVSKFFSSLRGLLDAGAAAQRDSTSLETHLLGAFKN